MKTMEQIIQEEKDHHEAAFIYPRGFERPIVLVWRGIQDYAKMHQERYEGDPIGRDAYMGDAAKDVLTGLLALLNGERGRLSAGLLDHDIREFAKRNEIEGFE